MLTNDDAVDSVFTDDVLAAAVSSLHIHMTTISVELAREIDSRHTAAGVRYLGAPVIGVPPVARAGQLDIMVGGDDATIRAVSPVLQALGKQVWPVGSDPTDAPLMKIAVNHNLFHALLAIGESMNMIEHGGIDG